MDTEPIEPTQQGEATPAQNSNTETLAWTVRLSDNAKSRRIVVWIAAVGAGLVGGLVLKSLPFALLGPLMVLGATAEFWLGSRFQLGPKEAIAKVGFSPTVIAYEDVKRVIVSGHSVRLSPLENSGTMDPFRGVLLRTTEENHEAVLAAIRTRVGTNARFLAD